jgi:hypothetical protein
MKAITWFLGDVLNIYFALSVRLYTPDNFLAEILFVTPKSEADGHSERLTASIATTMEVVGTYETSVYFESTRRNIQKIWHLHTRRRENLKSHTI